MARVSIAGLALGLVFLAVACGPPPTRYENRVRYVLEGLQREGPNGTGGDMQRALGMWALGVEVIVYDPDVLRAEKGLRAWAAEKGIDHKISDFQVLGSRAEDGPLGSTRIVAVTIEGKEYRIRVTEGQPMSWAD